MMAARLFSKAIESTTSSRIRFSANRSLMRLKATSDGIGRAMLDRERPAVKRDATLNHPRRRRNALLRLDVTQLRERGRVAQALEVTLMRGAIDVVKSQNDQRDRVAAH